MTAVKLGVASPEKIFASDPMKAARRVLRLEADALAALADALDRTFEHAVAKLASTRGRVVVTGMGKSGHVARKIAATLASTGTPALFVHPAEASHGDLGMITTSDAVLALSNSGETPELADIVAYSRRIAIPLIAIVGRDRSALASTADLALVLPDRPEACPLGLAPTTSTTSMMALGDALAVALLERRGFDSDEFGLLHPGGRLGQRLVRVEQLMHEANALPACRPEATIATACLEMSAKRLGCVGVVDDDHCLVGIVTDGDLRRHMSPGLFERPVSAIMTRGPKTIRAAALIAEAVAVMNAQAITVLFVVEDRRLVGALHLHDCLRAGVA